MNVLGVITARYGSTRFPGKVCADINNKPMVVWVYESAIKSSMIDHLVVATDDDRVVSICDSYSIPTVMTNQNHTTSGDRVSEVASKMKSNFVLEIQGDEPTLSFDILDRLVNSSRNDTQYTVFNSYTKIINNNEIDDVNVVKVSLDNYNCALSFSRYPIPYRKEKNNNIYFKQQGIYCYSRDCILNYSDLEKGGSEECEGIAMLRFLENQIKIKMVYTDHDTISVDVPGDIEKVRKILVV